LADCLINVYIDVEKFIGTEQYIHEGEENTRLTVKPLNSGKTI